MRDFATACPGRQGAAFTRHRQARNTSRPYTSLCQSCWDYRASVLNCIGCELDSPGSYAPGMTADAQIVSAQDLTVDADYGQILLCSLGWDTDAVDGVDEVYEGQQGVEALHEAWASERFVGVVPGFITVLTPGQWNAQTPLRLEVWSSEPSDDRDGWDHEVDADFRAPVGTITIGWPGNLTQARVPAGRYRVRISGRGYTKLGAAGANGDDSYRLRFWPQDHASVPVLRKRWPGWDEYQIPPQPEPEPG